MKKAFITFIALFLVNLCISAQIQRKFFDFTLGQTTKSEVENYLRKNGKEILSKTEDRIITKNMRFAGNNWNTVVFSFFKGKMVYVCFGYGEEIVSGKSVDNLWESLHNSLNKKYSEYYSERLSNDKNIYYQDNQTNLTLGYDTTREICAVFLMYSDNQLYNEKIAEEESEL